VHTPSSEYHHGDASPAISLTESSILLLQVPAHMPHMLDRHIIEEMQHRWSGEFEATSAHRFRAGDDMQYAFSYFYYLMHAVGAPLTHAAALASHDWQIRRTAGDSDDCGG
jgi:hypothetical protein